MAQSKSGNTNYILVIPLKEGLVKVKCQKIVKNILFLPDIDEFNLIHESSKKWINENQQRTAMDTPHKSIKKHFHASSLASFSSVSSDLDIKETLTNTNSDINGIMNLITENFDPENKRYNIESISKQLTTYKFDDKKLFEKELSLKTMFSKESRIIYQSFPIKFDSPQDAPFSVSPERKRSTFEFNADAQDKS